MALTPKQKAKVEKQLDEGKDAQAFLDRASRTCAACGQGSSIFAERKKQIIREAIAWFQSPSGSNDSHVAVRYIAALAEIVALQDALEYRANKADEARATLYAGGQTAEV